jgi:hypothetical protein
VRGWRSDLSVVVHEARRLRGAIFSAASPPRPVDDPDMRLGQDCFIVRDANGHALAYVYFEDEPGRRAAAHLLTREHREAAGPVAAGAIRPLVGLTCRHSITRQQCCGCAVKCGQ